MMPGYFEKIAEKTGAFVPKVRPRGRRLVRTAPAQPRAHKRRAPPPPARLPPRQSAEKSHRIHVGFEGNFGASAVTPRGLTARYLSRLVQLTGIATKCSGVHPKVARSVHYCPTTSAFTSREYRDATDASGGLPTGASHPSRDESGNLLEMEFGLSTYRDCQTFTVQEMPGE